MDISQVRNSGRWLFWGLTLGTVLLFIVAGFFIYQYSGQNEVAINLRAPDKVLAGAPFSMDINLVNNSKKDLAGAKINLLLPANVISPGESADHRVVTKEVGDVRAGETATVTIPLIIYKSAESIRSFTATGAYTVSGVVGTATATVEGKLAVTVQDPAVALDLAAPDQVLNNNSFTVKLDYKNAAQYDFANLDFILTLPAAVTLDAALPAAATGTTSWPVASLPRGSGGNILLHLRATGPDQSYFEIKAAVQKDGNLIAEKSVRVAIAPSPLSLTIATQDNQPVTYPGRDLHYILAYRNNTTIPMNAVVIAAKLTGTMFDLAQLRTSGNFNSINNSVTWNAGNAPDLELLRPGAGGTVEIEVPVKSQYAIRRLSDKNFVLNVKGEISSPTIPYYVSADKTTALAQNDIKVGGQISLARGAALKDNSGFGNIGPLPLKANTPTTLTIRWTLTDYAADMKNITIHAATMGGVRLTGKVKSTANSTPIWDQNTGQISWVIDRIPANKGVLGKPAEADFQIEATPNITQINQPMPLLGDMTLTATDDFTGSNLTATAPALDSNAIDDLAGSTGSNEVAP